VCLRVIHETQNIYLLEAFLAVIGGMTGITKNFSLKNVFSWKYNQMFVASPVCPYPLFLVITVLDLHLISVLNLLLKKY
jgi:hypothetical protein